ncbi:hypothetical protein AC579_4982 [Pseudocercospora musae]|uniref:Chitin-binding type-4 domain-containing protein n=1 Tax=Pseudocercospora musae TaxID=113226 RepID=A0A139IG28_9PEZI|nr:hypothetical protein AC579_4982 [Pseudocercospora musae]
MPSRTQPRLPITLCNLLLCIAPSFAHMEMSWPYPLHGKYNPDAVAADIDYSMTSPLSADGSNFPCKGYQNDRPKQIVETYTAGSSYNITLAGTATHKGGSCQISLSYDNGATFRVIKSIIGGCPLKDTYDFSVPSYAPNGNALLAWTWQNAVGNREFYMNCAEVKVVSGSQTRRRRRRDVQSFDQLPFIWKANLEGTNNCSTTEGDDPVYPNPGPDVEYGNGYSSSSASSPGACDSATPFGQTYEDLGDSTLSPPTDMDSPSPSGPADSYSASDSTITTSAAPKTTSAESYSDDSMTESWNHGKGGYSHEKGSEDSATESYDRSDHGRPGFMTTFDSDGSATEAWNRGGGARPTDPPRARPASTDSRSTVTVTADCASTVIVTVYPSATTPSSPSTMTTSTTPGASKTGIDRPPYATGSIESVNAKYTPCVPGTFLCTSKTTFLTCNYNDGTVKSDEIWVYSSRSERTVAAGMECLPVLAPYSSSTDQYHQQSGVKSGSYRDDRYIRERPDGDCDVDGSFKCTAGGSQFSICDHEGWVAMGAVAAGTTCSNGKIIASS